MLAYDYHTFANHIDQFLWPCTIRVQRMKFSVLRTFVLIGLLSFVPSLRAAELTKPNILFIMVDDLGKDWISCYGADDIQTPNIDALATGGMKFHNAWSMPQCTPTRVTLLTGQYPWRTGWVNHWDVPRWGVGYFDWKRNTTFAKVLSDAGYKTCIAGKWQINDFRVEPNALKKHGFDDWCAWTGYEAQNPPSAERYWNAYIHTREGSKTYQQQFGPDLYCNHIIQFMRTHRDQPMLLYFPMALTHGPFTTTPTEPDVQGKLPQHKAMVNYVDLLVGRLVKTLEQLQLRERTIVFFTTDNGTTRGVLGHVNGKKPSGGKASKFEGGICQPFIVNCPGTVPAGVESDELTDFSDLFPTFVELAGAKIPEGLPIDGHSLAPLILGKSKTSSRNWILSMGHGPAITDDQGVRGEHDYAARVLRDKRHKVWVNTNRQITHLYDLKQDPQEQKNILDLDAPDVIQARNKFTQILKTIPEKDARPQYVRRQALPWDQPRSKRLSP